MTGTRRPTPQSPPAATAGQTLSLSLLLRRAIVGTRGQNFGRLADVIVRLRGEDYPLVTGLVAEFGDRNVFVPARLISDWHTEKISLSSATIDPREFERRSGEVLLSADILGHRLIDIPRARLVRAYALRLTQTDDGWVLSGVDTRPRHWWLRLLRRVAGIVPDTDDNDDVWQDWKGFEALIGHRPSALVRAPFGRLRRLKPPQIADLLEDASREEQSELLQQVHTDPELEADVFEELDEERQSQLLRDLTNAEVADVLARMRADDAADAVMDLPQDRRRAVLDLLPHGQRVKVETLLSYHEASAGGLMGLDFLALPATSTVTEALDQVRRARSLQPEALTTIYSLDGQLRLRGAASLVTLLQADPAAPLSAIADANPVRVTPPADLITVTLLMTDYNLLTLPVVDEHDHLLGVITVDDALEATVPENWRHREPAPLPEHEQDDDSGAQAHAVPGQQARPRAPRPTA